MPQPIPPTQDEEFLAPSSRRRFRAFLVTWRRVRQEKTLAASAPGRLAGKLEWHEEGKTRMDSATRTRWLRRYYTWLRPWWPHLFGLVLLGLVATSLDLTMPLLTGLVLDLATTSEVARNETQRALAAMERVYEVLDRPDEKPNQVDCRALPGPGADLRFAGVNFAYGCEANQPGGSAPLPEGRRLVLEGLDLELPAGSVTALVGPSGSGKSTLADLLARSHDPSQGALLLGGNDIRSYRLSDYRRLFGIVAQDVFLFDGTVAENLRYARRDATDAELEAAAERANAMEFIRELPKGFAAVVGERGVKLSGGQRQRLSIARAILADPRFLILDEATSNLDTASEQLIQKALNDLLRSARRTTLVIAHRLSTIRSADQIVVLEKGRISERGSHASLMATGPGGIYHDMVRRQELSGAAIDAWAAQG